jgi:NAD(P)-dependent dehydrogenase (short-subunit alcohol dehydrogenase family)
MNTLPDHRSALPCARMANILITGTSSGIGLETAIHFARKGHRVFASARNPEGAPDLQAAIASGLPMTGVRIDVNDDASVREGVARCGEVDVLVNNAGIGGSGPVEISDIEKARSVFETNYFGAVRMIQTVAPGMRARRSGAIVNITSVAGLVTVAGHAHYCAAKRALEAATEALAAELKPFGIRVAAVEPGVILTPIFNKKPGRKLEDYTPYEAPMRRLWQYFRAQLETPRLPNIVAAAVEEAAFGTSGKLRYLVGPDAEALVRARTSVSDEEWVRVQAIQNDEEHYDEMARLMGGDYFRGSRSARE